MNQKNFDTYMNISIVAFTISWISIGPGIVIMLWALGLVLNELMEKLK